MDMETYLCDMKATMDRVYDDELYIAMRGGPSRFSLCPFQRRGFLDVLGISHLGRTSESDISSVELLSAVKKKAQLSTT